MEPPEVEVQVGMGVYGTTTPSCPAKVRVTTDDFRVSELVNFGDLRSEGGRELLPLYRVEKVGIDTLHVARRISEKLKSRVSFGGLKDRRAVVTQYLTPTSTRCERPSVIQEPTFKAELVGYLQRPLTRSMILGNSFTITIRETCDAVERQIEEAYRVCREGRLPNFFGLQRFGTRDPVTHLVGRALVRGNFEEALGHLLCKPRRGEEDRVRKAREMAAGGMYAGALEAFTRKQDLERIVLGRLVRRNDDFLGAFRALPVAIRRLFVHAYQSYLFNRTLTKILLQSLDISAAVAGDNWSELHSDGLTLGEVHGAKENPKAGALPLIQLVGYAYRDYGSRFDSLVVDVLKEEGVRPGDFYVKEAQEISAEGGFRRAYLTAKGMSSTLSGGDATLSFSLSKGEYATTLLREIIKPVDPFSAGF